MLAKQKKVGFRAGQFGILIAFTIFLLMQSDVSQVTAANAIFEEDFSTTTYQDGAITNATGWGSGSLTLPPKHPEQVSEYWLPYGAEDVCIHGDYAILASGKSGLDIVNVSDPENPVYITAYDFGGDSKSVDVEGECVYVVDFDNTDLIVFNITDITNPVEIGRVGTGLYPVEVHVDGNTAYVGSNDNALRVYNVTDPSNPTFLDYLATGDINDIDVDGAFAYLADDVVGLRIVNVTKRTEVVWVGNYTTPGRVVSVDVEGDCAYLLDWSYGFYSVNISNPTDPVLLGHAHFSGYPGKIDVKGDYAFVARSLYLEIYNVTDPGNPHYVDECEISFGNPLVSVEVEGEYAFVTGDYNGQGLAVVKISDFVNPVQIGHIPTDHQANAVSISGNYAYVSDFQAGLQVIDITDSTKPTIVDTYPLPSGTDYATDVAVSGDYVFLATEPYGLYILNATNPANLTNVTDLAVGGVKALSVDGDIAYLVNGMNLKLVNITDPTNPEVTESTPLPTWAYDVYVAGDIAYIADYSEGLILVNVTNQQDSYVIASCDTGGEAYGVWVSGDYAYVADSDSLISIDVHTPADPYIVDTHTPSTSSYVFYKVEACGDRAFVAGGQYGIHVYNISNPRELNLLGVGAADTAWALSISGANVYVACYDKGFRVLKIMTYAWEQYHSMATAASTMLVDTSPNPILRANLTVDDTIPSDTNITYYLSATGGTYWDEVVSNDTHRFSHTGTDLRWKAVFRTSNFTQAPDLSSLTIEYWTMIDAPTLISPSNSSSTGDDTPTFEWNSVDDASKYLLQIDSASSFDSTDLVNISESTTSYTPSSTLADGWWYWRVAGNDSFGDLGHFSDTYAVFIDSTPPTWDEEPQNQEFELGEDFMYNVNASDTSGISDYSINDTSNFAIDQYGVITSITALEVGDYGLEIQAIDSCDNICTATITISVEDTTSPVWHDNVWITSAEYGEPYACNVSAFDLSGIESYWINDTDHFNISSEGIITNSTSLELAENYAVRIRAYDPYDNYVEAIFAISVIDTTSPSWDELPVDQYLQDGERLDYQLHASDAYGIDQWSVNQTDMFTITQTGRLISIDALSSGHYPLLIKAYDLFDNYCQAEIVIHVAEDTTTTTAATTTSTTTTTAQTTPTEPLDIQTLLVIFGTIGAVVVIVLVVYLRRR